MSDVKERLRGELGGSTSSVEDSLDHKPQVYAGLTIPAGVYRIDNDIHIGPALNGQTETEGGKWLSPLEVESGWEEALDSLGESVDGGEAEAWEVALVRRRVRAAIARLYAIADTKGGAGTGRTTAQAGGQGP